MRRFTRLTNGFSRKMANLQAAGALHFTWYSFVRIHRSLGMTPAMAQCVIDRLWFIEDLLPVTYDLGDLLARLTRLSPARLA